MFYIPDSATSPTLTPCSLAINPSTLNITNPAKKLVPLLVQANITLSLQVIEKKHILGSSAV